MRKLRRFVKAFLYIWMFIVVVFISGWITVTLFKGFYHLIYWN